LNILSSLFLKSHTLLSSSVLSSMSEAVDVGKSPIIKDHILYLIAVIILILTTRHVKFDLGLECSHA